MNNKFVITPEEFEAIKHSRNSMVWGVILFGFLFFLMAIISDVRQKENERIINCMDHTALSSGECRIRVGELKKSST